MVGTFSPAQVSDWLVPGRNLFLALQVLGVACFIYIVSKRLVPLLRAQSDPRFDRPVARLARVLKFWLGQWKHPRVLEAEKYVIETALKKGLAPRAEIGQPPLVRTLSRFASRPGALRSAPSALPQPPSPRPSSPRPRPTATGAPSGPEVLDGPGLPGPWLRLFPRGSG